MLHNMARGWLRQIRKMKGLSEKSAGDTVGVAQSIFHRYETGELTPSVATAKKIGAALGFDWTLFFTDDDEKERKRA